MHKDHNVILLMDAALSISVGLLDDGNVQMLKSPDIVDSIGGEYFYCNTCQTFVDVEEDWQFV